MIATRCLEVHSEGRDRPPGRRSGNIASIWLMLAGTSSSGRVTLIGPRRPGGIIGQRGSRALDESRLDAVAAVVVVVVVDVDEDGETANAEAADVFGGTNRWVLFHGVEASSSAAPFR